MENKLHNLANVLAVANELHEKGDISEKHLRLLVASADTSIADSERFLKELKQWSMDLLQLDNSTNQIKVFKVVLTSFLQSPDADDHKLRGEALELMQHFKKLLLAMNNYNQQELVLNIIKNG